MVGGDCVDEMDCSSFFDQIEDLLDFPADDIDGGISGGLESFPSIWAESLSNNAASDLSAELSVPYEDIVQLEWLSTFVEDSFSGGGSLTMQKANDAVITKDLFHTMSPISVLESSTAEKPDPRCPNPSTTGKRVKARSKRSRPTTFNPQSTMHLTPPKSVGSSDSENYGESRPVTIKIAKKQLPNVGKNKKKMKLTVIQPAAPAEVGPEEPSQAIRKCLHCELTKTPQWRAGPLGPKTLCNACGVRYKSGRLFPEYRPAASPTFVPSVHSNSHKKVVEMRNKTCDSPIEACKSSITISPHSELIPNTNVQLDYM